MVWGSAVTNPALDDYFRRAHALRVEAIQHLTPEIRVLIESQLSIQERARGIEPMDAMFFEKWLLMADEPAKTLLQQANDCYWRVVLQMNWFCRKKANQHHHRLNYQFEDLYQAARLGCWRAAIRFDPDRGYKFVSFAEDWVRVHCDRTRNLDHDLSIGNNRASSGEWHKGTAARLDAPILGLDEVRVIEQVAIEEVEAPDTMALARMRQAMDDLGLTDMQRACLESVGDEDLTLTDIAKRFGKSREWARQLRNTTLEKIKAAMLETKETKETKEVTVRVKWPYYRKDPPVPGVCLVQGCDHRKILWRGLCKTHYNALNKYDKLNEFALPPKSQVPRPLEIEDRGLNVCLVKDCENIPHGRGFCRKHYNRAEVDGYLDSHGRPSKVQRSVHVDGICIIKGCDRKRVARGLCINCYNNARNNRTLETLALPSQARAPRKRKPISKEPTVASYPGPLPDELINPKPPASGNTIDLVLGLPATATESDRLTAIRGLLDQVAAQDNAIRTMARRAWTRTEVARAHELLSRADAIRDRLGMASASVSYDGIEVPLTPALERALRDHADALEAEALRGAP